MIQSLLTAIGIMIAISVGWLLIQVRWKETFSEEYVDEDVLIKRRSCSNCGCTTVCENKK